MMEHSIVITIFHMKNWEHNNAVICLKPRDAQWQLGEDNPGLLTLSL